MPISPRILASVIVLTPTIALACPTSSDLAGGIMVVFDEGSEELYTGIRAGLVRMQSSYDGDVSATMDLASGTYVLSYMDVFDGQPDTSSRITTAYPGGLSSLPAPTPGQRWSQPTIVTDSNGPYPETVEVAWADQGQVGVGDCSYTAIEGIIAYKGEGVEPYFEGITFLPELGIGYVNWYQDEAGREDYVVYSISAVN